MPAVYPVTETISLELNANDLMSLHSLTLEGVRYLMNEGPRVTIDPARFDLLRRIERGILETTDVPCEDAGFRITQRADVERVNLWRLEQL